MFKADLRSFEAIVRTLDFHVAGALHLASHVHTLQALNTGTRPHLAITDCVVARPDGTLGAPAEEDGLYRSTYVALPKDRIRWLAGGEGEPPQPGVQRETRRVIVLYSDHLLEGHIALPPGQRLRDFVSSRSADRPFYELKDVEVRPHGDGEAVHHPFMAVNFRLAGALNDVAESREGPILFEE